MQHERDVSIHSSQQHEDRLLQTLNEVREQMKEQQAQSDHEREQMALDPEHILQEKEKLGYSTSNS